jgi:hypothetical protein
MHAFYAGFVFSSQKKEDVTYHFELLKSTILSNENGVQA